MTKRLLIAILLIIAHVLASPTMWADVRLPRTLSSHMVLQRNTSVAFWGWSDPGERITISADWLDDAVSVTADAEGNWRTNLQTLEAGDAHTIQIEAKNQIQLIDVLFGEVWLASGQSNMEMPLTEVSGAYTGIQNAKQEVENALHPHIRLFQAGNFSSKEPLDDVQPGIVMYGIPPAQCSWQVCTRSTIPTFSSTAYFFARELHKQLDVPIGIIDSSWGGTSAEAWTPASGLRQLGYTKDLELAATTPQKADQKVPTRLYNGMIHPLRNMTIKGAIWYQGEGNTGRADKYQRLFATMIGEWRKAWGYEFPFYFVQISPFNYNNVNAAYLREAQMESMSLPRTGMAATMDIGNLTDIHPKNKQEVGRRLAIWALAKDYARDVDFSGPVFHSSVREGDSIRIKFDHAEEGLTTQDGQPPSHFEISADDKIFYPATATIDGADVVVTSSEVTTPVAVRYAFTSNAVPNLVDKSGLPASSFRTDRWKTSN